MRLLPTGIALLTALVLFAAQQFYFEIDDAHDNAVGQAEALLDLARATRAWSDGEIHGVMGDAVGHFEHVVSASYCHSGHCVHIETVESGEDCTADRHGNWKSLCVSTQLAGSDDAVTLRYSLVEAHLESIRNVLVLAAILAFVSKVGQGEARRYVHFGWIAALALGAATWFVSSRLIAISGADREVTEGVTALIAAAMLLYVGFWLHDKTHAAAWQAFIKERVGGSIAQGTVWTLALISFLAVYREIFETVLFYQALAAQAGPEGHGALLAGVAVGALLLAAFTWAILRWSARIPLGLFFGASALLMAVLAVVFTGQGVAALQEAGWINVKAVSFLRLPMLGIFPTLQTLGAQAVVMSIIVAALWWAKHNQKVTQKR